MTLVCWVFIMVRSDLTGMLTDSMPVPCGQTPLVGCRWHCDIIWNTEQSITGNLQLNNSHCADGVLGYLSHADETNMHCPCSGCHLCGSCSSFSWHCMRYWTLRSPITLLDCCGARYYVKMFFHCENFFYQSHITHTISVALRMKQTPDDSPEKSIVNTRLKMDLIQRNSWYLGSICGWQTVNFLCVVVLSGMGGCTKWLNLDKAASNLVWVIVSLGRPHVSIIKACCGYFMKIYVNSPIINKTCFYLDLELCFVVKHIWHLVLLMLLQLSFTLWETGFFCGERLVILKSDSIFWAISKS